MVSLEPVSVEALVALGKIAEDQWGLVTTRQAEQQGVSRRKVSQFAAAGLLEQAPR